MDVSAGFSPLLAEVFIRLSRIILLLAVAYAASFLLRRLVPRFIRAALHREQEELGTEELNKREHTLIGVAQGSVGVLLTVTVALTVLAELQVDIAPALASLGVVGIAVGFGAQSLVKDIFSGLFILLEDQYRRGDVVTIAGIGGVVEEVNLRRTVLRDVDGTVHSIPNGEVRVASNLTKRWSRVNIDVSVAYDTDIDRAREIINQVGKELAEDREFGPSITEAPRFVRVQAFESSGILLKVLGVTKPSRQWDVAGEYRYRLLRAFASSGIQLSSQPRPVVAKTAPQATTDK